MPTRMPRSARGASARGGGGDSVGLKANHQQVARYEMPGQIGAESALAQGREVEIMTLLKRSSVEFGQPRFTVGAGQFRLSSPPAGLARLTFAGPAHLLH